MKAIVLTKYGLPEYFELQEAVLGTEILETVTHGVNRRLVILLVSRESA